MGNVILITGSTGFVGKVVVETLFRCRTSFPFDKIVVLVRANKTKSGRERFLDLAKASPCFSLLPPSWIDDVRVIEGDMGEDDCGIADTDDAAYLYENTTHIIHCAASISFSAAADVLLRENVGSSLNLLALARRCPKLRHAVLTSTAYVTPWTTAPIHERLVPLPLPAAELCEQLRSGALSGDAALALTGHPNLYTLTKCLAEHVVAEARAGLPPDRGAAQHRLGGVAVPDARLDRQLRRRHGSLHGRLDGRPARRARQPRDRPRHRPRRQRGHEPGFDLPGRRPAAREEQWLFLGFLLFFFSVAHNIHAVQVYRIMTSARLPAHPTMQPDLRYYGQNALWLSLADFVHQAVPVALGRAWAALCGNAKLARSLTKARRMQRSCNALFAHFGSHAYDFRSSRDTLEAEFEADEYLERVFRGAGKFLLKLDVSLQTVAMEKLYSESEAASGSESASSSGGSINGGDDDSSSADDDDGDSESVGSPASSIMMDVAGAASDDAAKTGDAPLVVQGGGLLPEIVVTAAAVAL
ncbi:uncharacterized protein PG986_005795 [Apiospora aurea]|uniref:Fatty acyl-CoA reductase n=1 Tax=Apiospora aurea TaxID=335848 RepID=A0ABR1QIK5_9PEZI